MRRIQCVIAALKYRDPVQSLEKLLGAKGVPVLMALKEMLISGLQLPELDFANSLKELGSKFLPESPDKKL